MHEMHNIRSQPTNQHTTHSKRSSDRGRTRERGMQNRRVQLSHKHTGEAVTRSGNRLLEMANTRSQPSHKRMGDSRRRGDLDPA